MIKFATKPTFDDAKAITAAMAAREAEYAAMST